MKIHDWDDLRKRKLSPEKLAEIDREIEAEVLEMNLRDLRELVGKTQEEVAQAAQMSQPELSRTERREDHRLSTLRRYVEALGGEIEVVAHFGNRMVKLRGV